MRASAPRIIAMLATLGHATIVGTAAASSPSRPATAAPAADDAPKVFSNLSLEEAKKQTKEKKQWLLVNATATWCPPCQQMKKTTWREETVEAWFKEHGTAIMLDVDKFESQAQDLKIEGMPTLVLFKAGEEFDRVVGFQDGEQLVAWLNGALKGEKASEKAARELAERLAKKDTLSMQDRYDLANELVSAGKQDEATAEFVWLWKNMIQKDESMIGVRVSFMRDDMQMLAADHEPAKQAFTALRDELSPRINAPGLSTDTLMDWITLNTIVADPAATLTWYDLAKADPAKRDQIKDVSYLLETLFQEEERWSDLGALYPDPVARVRETIGMENARENLEEILQSVQEEFRDQFKEMMDSSTRDRLCIIYGATLAAGNEPQAAKVADEILKFQDSGKMRLALVEWAIRVDRPLETHAAWVDQAQAMNEDVASVRAGLKAALAARPNEDAPLTSPPAKTP